MKIKILLIFAVLVGFIFRFWKVDVRPLGFTWDEAALGYNAYSLLKTGKDEFGQEMPIIFKSFGDYKPGLYIYSAVPSIKIFGLNEFSTRLPSVIFGTLLILALFVMVSRLFNPYTGLATSWIIALNPWAIIFSRGAWEANVALLLSVLGVSLFLTRRFKLSAVFFGLTLLTYQGAKLFTPLLIIGLLLFFKSRYKIKQLIFPLITLGLFSLPLIIGWSAQSGRLNVYSILNYHRTAEEISSIRSQEPPSDRNILFTLYHSETFSIIKNILERYLNHLSPRFLFIEGDWSNIRHSVSFYGYFHIPDILLLVLGIPMILRQKKSSAGFVFWWLITAPLPSALSRDIVSGVRSLPLVIPVCVILSFGLIQLIKHRKAFILYSAGAVFFLIYFLDLYFVHNPDYAAKDWLYPYKPAITLVDKYISQYQHALITDQLGQPYIFVLFYNQVDPAWYQKNVNFTAGNNGDVGSVKGFGKYTFSKFYWPDHMSDVSTIFVGDQYELPEIDLTRSNVRRLGEINYPNGQSALRIIALQ